MTVGTVPSSASKVLFVHFPPNYHQYEVVPITAKISVLQSANGANFKNDRLALLVALAFLTVPSHSSLYLLMLVFDGVFQLKSWTIPLIFLVRLFVSTFQHSSEPPRKVIQENPH